MKVYIAGSSQELGRCERAVAAALKMGFVITYDWTHDVRRAAAAGVLEHEMPEAVRRDHGAQDLRGVEGADAVILLLPERGTPSRGCWVELGYALGRGKPVYLLRSTLTASAGIFEAMCTAVYGDDDRRGLATVLAMHPERNAL